MIKNINLYRSDSSVYYNVDGLSLQNLFYVKNGYFPNCYMFTKPQKSGDTFFDTISMLSHFKNMKELENEMEIVSYKTLDVETKEEYVGFSIVFAKKNLYARFEKSIEESYVLYGENNDNDVTWIINEILPFYSEEKKDKNNIFLISNDSFGFSLSKWCVNEVSNFDIEKQYNDDFLHYDKLINNFISSDDKSGLVILHGEKGSGKSTYIRHMVNSYQDKKFIFVHSGLISLLGDPAFNNFLLKMSDSIIILEDCEDALKSRKTSGSSSSAVSILLNMTDGLLADNLHIKFICTFNEDISSIDDALLRKGRLVCKYEFKKLKKDKATSLLTELYPDETVEADNDMTLADIYNYFNDSFEKRKSNFI